MDKKLENTAAIKHGIDEVLSSVYSRHVGNQSGRLANYIPELAAVDPERFGIAVASTSGDVYTIGDAETPFTIQSVSKAFIYCVALEVASRTTVLKRVGVEPSGDAFNAIVFDPSTNRPFNPMVNAGAITVTGIIRDVVGSDAFELILKRLSEAAGRQLTVDESVYRSESETGHRNRAIGHCCAMSVCSAARSKKCSISISGNARSWSRPPISPVWARRSPTWVRIQKPAGRCSICRRSATRLR